MMVQTAYPSVASPPRRSGGGALSRARRRRKDLAPEPRSTRDRPSAATAAIALGEFAPEVRPRLFGAIRAYVAADPCRENESGQRRRVTQARLSAATEWARARARTRSVGAASGGEPARG